MTAMAPARRFPTAVYVILLVLIAIFSVLPVFTTVISAVIANSYGCTVNEGNLNPCIIGGTDYGYWLQFGGMSFLYIFVTFPIGFVLFIAWLVVLLVHLARFKKRPA
jgi:hypothetical protein